MPKFENPPQRALDERQAERARHILLINGLHEALLRDIEEFLEHFSIFDERTEARASVGAEITAHELTVARLDREIAEIETQLLHKEPITDPERPATSSSFVAHA